MTTEAMNQNMFVIIEQYLAAPTEQMADKIKKLSHGLTKRAYAEAVTKYPGKKIGADEYQLILLDIINEMAAQAFQYSCRLMINSKTITDSDPTYIFRLNQTEHQLLHELKGDALKAKDTSPDGLIFAYACYIERRRSQFSYCSDEQAQIFKSHTKLYLKAQELIARNPDTYKVPAQILKQAYRDVIEPLREPIDDTKDLSYLANVLGIIETAKSKPEIQAHRGLKQIFINFMLSLSGFGLIYLAWTKNERSSFWYRPETNSETCLGNVSAPFSQIRNG